MLLTVNKVIVAYLTYTNTTTNQFSWSLCILHQTQKNNNPVLHELLFCVVIVDYALLTVPDSVLTIVSPITNNREITSSGR